jgi:hypothetical protein
MPKLESISLPALVPGMYFWGIINSSGIKRFSGALQIKGN